MSNLATITNNILADSGIDDINVIVSTGSYANPAWITSLAWTKITGAPANIVTGTGTATQVAFWTSSGVISSSSGFYWDNSAGRLAVGKNDSNARLEVYAGTKGQIRANGGTAMGGGVDIYTELSGTARRNWGIQTEVQTPGDFSILCSNTAGTAPVNEVFTIQNTGVGSYKFALNVVGNLSTSAKLGAADNNGVFYRGVEDVTWKTYYKTASPNGLYTEINGNYFIDAYNSGTPITRFSFTTAGNFTATAVITGQEYVSNAINVADEWYFFKGNSTVSNALTMYTYANIVYVNAYSGYHIRSNNTGGSGGYINLHGSSIMLGTANAPILHSGTRGVVIQGSARGILEIWDASSGKSVFQNVGGTTYIGQLDKASGSGDLYLLVNGSGTSADVGMLLKANKNVLIGTETQLQFDERLGVSSSTNTAILAQFTGGATSGWASKFWNNGTSGNNLIVEFLTESSITARGSIRYDRTGNRLNIVGEGSGLLFTGAATFSSSVTATRLITTNGQNTLANSSNLSYIGKGDDTFFSGFNFQGVATSDMFFGRAANSDDLIISQSGIVSPIEIIRFTQGGNVGIGTTSPSDFIDASLGLAIISTSGRSGLSLGSTQGTANEVLGRLSFTNTNSTNIGNKRLAYISGIRGTTDNSAYLEFGTADNALGTQRMVISQTGNVGIGTSSPDTYSYGGTRKFLTLTATATNEEPFLQLIANGSGNSLIDFGNATIRRATIIGFDGSHLAFYTNGSNSGTSVTERMRITSDGIVDVKRNMIVGSAINNTQNLNISENQIFRTGAGEFLLNFSGTGNIRAVEGGGSLLVNTGTRWNQERFGIQISNSAAWTSVPAMMRLTNYTSGGRTKITFTDSSIIDGWLGMTPVSNKSYFVMGFAGYTEEGFKVYQNGYAYVQNRLGVNVDYDSLGWKFQVADVGSIITGGEAISTSNMKGVMIENTNNGDESIGVWFRTGSNHLSGISAQRTNNAIGWATDLRFYTHQQNTVSLTSAFERVRITGEGEMWIGYTSDQGAYMLQVNGSTFSSTGFFESSDIRLKTILNRHQSLDFDAIEYKWNDGRDSKLHWGYAAQEVMKFLPDAVNGTEELFYTLDYNQVHTYKIAMIEKRIAELEQQFKNK